MTQGRDFPLLSAAQTGDARAALRAIKSGASPWAKDPVGDTALVVAARHGHDQVCSVILRACRDAGKDPLGGSLAPSLFLALERAAGKNRALALALLLSEGAARAHDPSFQPGWSEALCRAFEASIIKGDGSATVPLLDAGLNPNAALREPARKRPLHLCALNGQFNLAAARALLERGADPEGRDDFNQPPLHELFASGSRWLARQEADSEAAIQAREFVSLLSAFGARPSTPVAMRMSAMALAREQGPLWLADHLDAEEALCERRALSQILPVGAAKTPKLAL